jgi:hypothetical protein
MTPADLVAITARLLDLPTDEALALVDLPAAEEALRADDAAGLLMALVLRRPVVGVNDQVALLATLQHLGERGLNLDLRPPHVARDLVRAIRSGTADHATVTAWIDARLCKEPGMLKRLIHRGKCEFEPVVLDSGERYEHMTDRARDVVASARAEARSMRHNYVGTEHILLGLLGQRQGPAAEALARLNVAADDVRADIERIVGTGHSEIEDPPFSPRAKKVLDLAQREAKRHGYVGTEHILLALVREGEGLAAQILHRPGVDRATIVRTVMDILGAADPSARGRRRAHLQAELDQVFDENERLHAEVDRLRALLRRHGIEPDSRTA